MEAVDVRGQFVWHELLTRDAAGAKAFYSKLTGWKPQAWPLDPSYTVCHSDHGPTAGIFTITPDFPADVPAQWMGYVGTRDVDGTVGAAVRAGGSLVKGPENIKGAGRYALLKDPQGAFFAIIDPENARPETDVPPLGTFSWHELVTSDNEAAFAFYGALFGWEVIARMDMGPIGTYLIFGSNGKQRGGMYVKPAGMPGPPHWLPYAHVPSADDAATTAASAGAQVKQPPMDIPGGRVAVFLDPTGAAIAVHSMGAARAAAPAKKAATKPKAKAKVKAKAKAKAKGKPAKKAAAKKKVAKKSAARKPAAKKKSSARRKK